MNTLNIRTLTAIAALSIAATVSTASQAGQGNDAYGPGITYTQQASGIAAQIADRDVAGPGIAIPVAATAVSGVSALSNGLDIVADYPASRRN